MHNLTKAQTAGSWLLQLIVAGILLQTLFFKFTAAEESVYIFTAVGRFLGVGGVEPWGRIGSGVVELAAAILLLVPATASLGAILTIGVMAGAIAGHVFILGIEVKGDGGLLFGLALAALVGSVVVLVLRRTQIPVVGRHFELVSRLGSSLCTEGGEAPGWQGAKSEHIGNIRTMSNAASRDASPAECQRTSETRH